MALAFGVVIEYEFQHGLQQIISRIGAGENSYGNGSGHLVLKQANGTGYDDYE